MKRNPYYTLQRINNTPYLMPFGQAITEHKRSVAINETGEVLWHLLEQDYSFEELVKQAAAYYELPWERTAALSADIRTFVGDLFREGILLENSIGLTHKEISLYLRIAGLTIQIDGPVDKLEGLFSAYEIPDPHNLTDLRVVLTMAKQATESYGTPLVQTPHLMISEGISTYEMEFPSNRCVRHLSLFKNGKLAVYRYIPGDSVAGREEFFHALRQSFLYLAWLRDMLVLHSASVLYHGKAYLFSGHSGMGKSTHANLWHTLYDVPILNGDLNLIQNTQQGPVIKGIPWCGTSGISNNGSYPLGGIILLSRAGTDSVETLSPADKVLSVSKRLISPTWAENQLHKNLSLTRQIAESTKVCRLFCTKEPSAAKVMKQFIDNEFQE